MMGLKKNNPGCGCCGVPPYGECEYCAGSGSNAPRYVTIEVSGVANDSCDECAAEWNGTWVAEVSGLSSCTWNAPGPNLCGIFASQIVGFVGADLTYPPPAGGFGWWVHFFSVWGNVAHGIFAWNDRDFTWPDPVLPECLKASEETFEFKLDDPLNYCDLSGATVLLWSGDVT